MSDLVMIDRTAGIEIKGEDGHRLRMRGHARLVAESSVQVLSVIGEEETVDLVDEGLVARNGRKRSEAGAGREMHRVVVIGDDELAIAQHRAGFAGLRWRAATRGRLCRRDVPTRRGIRRGPLAGAFPGAAQPSRPNTSDATDPSSLGNTT